MSVWIVGVDRNGTARLSRQGQAGPRPPWLIVLLAVLLVLVVVDRVAVGIAEDQIADRVQESQSAGQQALVDIAGFPFLTQVIRGRYKQVTVDVNGLERDGLRLVGDQDRRGGRAGRPR